MEHICQLTCLPKSRLACFTIIFAPPPLFRTTPRTTFGTTRRTTQQTNQNENVKKAKNIKNCISTQCLTSGAGCVRDDGRAAGVRLEWRILRSCAAMRVHSHPQASNWRQLSALFYLWQIVLKNELACGWLSERGRHSERPGPARASLVRIRSGFRSDSEQEFSWILIRIRTESPSRPLEIQTRANFKPHNLFTSEITLFVFLGTAKVTWAANRGFSKALLKW